MIDLESYVFDKVSTALETQFTGIAVKAEYTAEQDTFPCVTIECKDNYVHTDMISGERIENAVDVMFEVNVYTNTGAKRKKDAKKILDYADGQMASLGFVRQMLSPIDNVLDSSVYRYMARYVATIDFETNGNNTTYFIYTR